MAVARRDERWMAEVADALASGLRDRVETARKQGRSAAELGPPADVARRMLETVPFVAPSPWNELGPFYSAKGIARMLGGVTRQAVEDRRRRGRIVAVRTTDGVWLYPSFQFDADGTVNQAVVGAFATFRATGMDEWTAAAMVVSRLSDLGDRSVVEYLRDGGDEAEVALVARRAEWSRRR